MNKLVEFLQSTEHLSNTGFVVRTVVVTLIYFMTRFLKKRASGQFTAFDFSFLWMLGALVVAPLLDGKILFSTTIMTTATLYLWHFIISWLGIRNRAFAKLIRRKPTILIEKGKINEKNMRQTFFNNDLLLSEMRLAEAHDLKEVDQVILETSGHLSVVKKSEHVPPTSIDFNIPLPPGGLPTILVNNGKIIQDHLKNLGLNEEWLMNRLYKNGIMKYKDVYLATVSPDGDFYYSVKNIQ